MTMTPPNDTTPVPMTPSPFQGDPINIYARAFFATLGSLMIVSGVLGNCVLVTAIFRRFHRKRHVHNLFIANLALADMLTLGYWLTFFVLDLALGHYPVVNQGHCVVNGMVIGVLSVVSVVSLLLISLNRYTHVCHSPLYARLFTLPRTLLCCAFTWGLGLLLSLPPTLGLQGAGSYHYSRQTHLCSFNRERLTYSKLVVLLFSTLPMLFTGYWNFAIFRFWRKARMSWSLRYPLVLPPPQPQGEERKTRGGRFVSTFTKKRRLRPVKGKESLDITTNCQSQSVEVVDQDHRMRDISCVDVEKPVGLNTDGKSGHFENKNIVPEITVTECENSESLHCRSVVENTDLGIAEKGEQSCMNEQTSSSYTQKCSPPQEGNNTGLEKLTKLATDLPKLATPTNAKMDIVKAISDSIKDKSKMRKHQNASVDSGSNPQKQSETLSQCRCAGAENTTAEQRNPENKPASAMDGSVTELKPPVSNSPSLSVKRSLSKRPKHNLSTAMHHLQRRKKQQKAREVAFVRSLLVVFILMLVCFTPYGVIVFVSSYVTIPPEVVMLGVMFLFLNNSINWVVYGVMNPAFRHGYVRCVRRVWNACRCCSKEGSLASFLNASHSSLVTTSVQMMNTENDLEPSCMSWGPLRACEGEVESCLVLKPRLHFKCSYFKIVTEM